VTDFDALKPPGAVLHDQVQWISELLDEAKVGIVVALHQAAIEGSRHGLDAAAFYLDNLATFGRNTGAEDQAITALHNIRDHFRTLALGIPDANEAQIRKDLHL